MHLATLTIVFIRVFKNSHVWSVLRDIWLFSVVAYATGLYWLFISMHTYGHMAWPLAAMGVVLLASFLALYPAIMCAIAYVLMGRPANTNQSWLRILLISLVWASAWTMAEWLRGVLFTGFPWLGAGYAHIDGWLAPWSSVVGSYGVGWFATFTATSIAILACHKDTENDAKAAAGVGLAIIAGLIGIGLGYVTWTKPEGSSLIVRLVQGNVPQSEKFDAQLMQQGIEQYMKLASLDAKSSEGKPNIIVLPETVIPIMSAYIPTPMWQQLIRISEQKNATIIMGVPISTGARQGTNSVIAINQNTSLESLEQSDLKMRYDKHHLVPFGEFVPKGFQWFVNAMQIPLGTFDRGGLNQRPFNIEQQLIAPNICYEDVFGEEIIHHARDSNILLNVSNLAWFGNTWALRQHLQIARARSLETGRPMLRSTNTGMTAAIDPNGRVRAVLNSNTPGVLDVEVQGMQGYTPYMKWGNLPVLILSLMLLVVGACNKILFRP